MMKLKISPLFWVSSALFLRKILYNFTVRAAKGFLKYLWQKPCPWPKGSITIPFSICIFPGIWNAKNTVTFQLKWVEAKLLLTCFCFAVSHLMKSPVYKTIINLSCFAQLNNSLLTRQSTRPHNGLDGLPFISDQVKVNSMGDG